MKVHSTDKQGFDSNSLKNRSQIIRKKNLSVFFFSGAILTEIFKDSGTISTMVIFAVGSQRATNGFSPISGVSLLLL
jgi:hypothetical protein